MKRQRSWDASRGGWQPKQRRTGDYFLSGRVAMPRRTYPRSRVPLASRGYRPNRFERKVVDVDRANYNINTTGSLTLLNLAQLGSDMTNRIGRKTTLRSVYIRGHVKLQQADQAPALTAPGQQWRFMLVWDTQPNGAAPAITAILKESTPESQLNLDNRDRFKILKDKHGTFDMIYSVTTATQSQFGVNHSITPFKCYKKFRLETIYNATNGNTIADITSGALYMLWIGNIASSVNDAIASLTTRVRFDDS